MKKIVSILMLCLFLASCGKPFCKECKYPGSDGPHAKICRDDFSSNKAYKDFIASMEDSGRECKSDMLN